jgi:teichuronic acid biosynthesis glycosyltransferase TuaG
MPLVSVIVTTFNRKDKLKETLDSILCQSFQDFELIVVDNFSDYDFVAFINSFENEKLIPIQNNNHGIIAVNRNVGIKNAKGEFIAFCDDDDIWVPHKLATQLDALQNANADFVSSNAFIFDKEIHQITGKSKNRLVRNINDFLKSNQISTSTVLVRKSKMLFFDEARTLESIEDYALWLELYIAGYKFSFIEENLIFYRYSSSNISINNWIFGHYRKIFLFSQMAIKHPNLKIEFTLHLVIIQNLIIIMAKKILQFFKLK